MGLSLWNLFKSGLLVMNALLILNRRRFLSQYGLDPSASNRNNNSFNGGGVGNDGTSTMKVQIIGLLQAVQYLKVPIIICNAITIVLEMLLGGT